MKTIPRNNAVVIVGDIGIDQLLGKIYDHWDRGQEYALVWHLHETHGGVKECIDLPDTMALLETDLCPRMIFTTRPISELEARGYDRA